MSEKRIGNLFYDPEIGRYKIRYDIDSYYGGLHCGDCFEVKVHDTWVPVRIEMADDWYLVGLPNVRSSGMESGKKRKYMKPEMKFVTDFHIVLECIHEVYRQEVQQVLEGKDIRKTMIFPFLKMLENHCEGITLEQMHKMLWKEYCSAAGKEVFLVAADNLLQPYRKNTEEGGTVGGL